MSSRSRQIELAALVGLFVLAVGYAVILVRPIHSGSVGPDAAAPVIHFERIVAGRHLEGYLGQTPKPLLTVIYGTLYSAAHDWRPIVWVTIGAYALGVVLATVVALRIAGLASAAFAAVALLVSPTFASELAYSYAIPWAFLAWSAAGVALVARRPHYAMAGTALLLGSLARIETLLLATFALIALVVVDIRARRSGRPPPPRRAYLVSLAFLAVPVMLAHDWLLTGDPWFWLNIARENSEAAAASVRSPIRVAGWLVLHLLDMAPILPLAALGSMAVLLRRQWVVALGLIALGPGVAAFLLFLAARGIYVSARYLGPIDLSLAFAAAVGIGLVAVRGIRLAFRRPPIRRLDARLVPILVGASVAFFVAPNAALSADVRAAVSDQVSLHSNAQLAMAAIRSRLGSSTSWRAAGPSSKILVIVPSQLRAQAVVDLDLPLTSVAKAKGEAVAPSKGRPEVGQIVYRDRVDAGDSASFAVFEINGTITVGNLRFVPIITDARRGFWVVQVESAE